MRKSKSAKWLRVIPAAIFLIGGIVGGLYAGLWLMMVKPIIAACAAFDAGSLTATIIGATVLKFVFGGAVGWTIFGVCALIGRLILGD